MPSPIVPLGSKPAVHIPAPSITAPHGDSSFGLSLFHPNCREHQCIETWENLNGAGRLKNDHLRKTKDLATSVIPTGGIKKHKEHKKHKTPRSGPFKNDRERKSGRGASIRHDRAGRWH